MASELFENEVTQPLFYNSGRSSDVLDLHFNSDVDPQYEPPKKKGKGKTIIDVDLSFQCFVSELILATF